MNVLSDLVTRALSLRACGVLGGALLIVHQLCLSRLGLSDFILHAPRQSWIEQNREGVASVVGYLSLYLIALQLAEAMMNRTGKVHTTLHVQAMNWRLQCDQCSTLPRCVLWLLSAHRSLLATCRVVSVVKPAWQECTLLCQLHLSIVSSRLSAVARAALLTVCCFIAAVVRGCSASCYCSRCCMPRVRSGCSPPRDVWSARYTVPQSSVRSSAVVHVRPTA